MVVVVVVFVANVAGVVLRRAGRGVVVAIACGMARSGMARSGLGLVVVVNRAVVVSAGG